MIVGKAASLFELVLYQSVAPCSLPVCGPWRWRAWSWLMKMIWWVKARLATPEVLMSRFIVQIELLFLHQMPLTVIYDIMVLR